MAKVTLPFSDMKDLPDVKILAASLKQEGQAGKDAGLKLAQDAASFGMSVKDYVTLAGHKQTEKGKDGLNAYEKLLLELNLPVRNDLANGVYLQAASETFQTFPGTRALFPEVIDQVLRWAVRQDQFESTAPMISNSRTINGPEMLSTVVDDDSAERDSFLVSEGANIPIRTIRTSEKTVKIWKHGSGIRTTYEFSRRASLDILTPYAARIMRELELSKVRAATAVLINGDGAYGAADVVTQSSLSPYSPSAAVAGQIYWPSFLAWLVARAQAGTPVDTVLMNWDSLLQWMLMFGTQTENSGGTIAQALQGAGVSITQMPSALAAVLKVTPVLSSSMTAGRLLGYSRGDTLEELVEAGSNIQETERAIKNQTVVIKTVSGP